MSDAALRFLRSFQALSQADQHDILVSLLRLPVEIEYPAPSEGELLEAADEVFQVLGRAESGQ